MAKYGMQEGHQEEEEEDDDGRLQGGLSQGEGEAGGRGYVWTGRLQCMPYI
jgi:hypothetical protein